MATPAHLAHLEDRERRWLSRPLAALATLIAAICALSALALQMWASGAFLVVIAGLLAVCTREWPRAGVAASPLLAGIGLLAAIPDWLRVQDDLVASARAGAWGVHEQAAMYTMHWVMALAGLICGMPEAAAEAALLGVPPPAGEQAAPARTFSSAFPMQSAGVRAAVEEDIRRVLERKNPARADLPARRCTWGGQPGEIRAAAALDPLTLQGEPVPDSAPPRLRYRATVPVRYPDGERPIRFLGLLDERLFAALARDGWHHPYDLTYEWTVDAALPLALPDDIPWIDDAVDAWNSARHGARPGACEPIKG